jgi:hypothetical protein
MGTTSRQSQVMSIEVWSYIKVHASNRGRLDGLKRLGKKTRTRKTADFFCFFSTATKEHQTIVFLTSLLS